ncbi:MAG: LCP family protein [Anaerolineales bacterium]|nr:LCP family protein [Anaerolineales bacterium]MDW8226978.1 LCP family protein [Anaerolineales bacterium]
MRRFCVLAFALFLLTVACTETFVPPALPTPALALVTLPANPTATATPFHPAEDTALLATLSPLSPVPASFLEATATPFQPNLFDPNAILPTAGTPVSFDVPSSAPDPATPLTDYETVTFLLLGSDQRKPNQKYFRTDILIIAALRPKNRQVSLISIPRDLYVYIPTVGMDRINAAYEYGIMYRYPGGGRSLLSDTILYNLGVRIDHIAIVDFDGFRKIVDTLGGIEVPVACPYTDWRLISPDLNPNDPNNWHLYTVQPGLVYMDGDLALWYARSRSKSSDFDRARRSQEVLRALYRRIRSPDVFGKIPELYGALQSSVNTDLGLQDLLHLMPLALQMTNADIRSYYIGRGYVSAWTTPKGAYVLRPNREAIQALLEQALAPRTATPQTPKIKVEIRNGTPNEDWEHLAAERLNYAGYETTLAPADRRDYERTLLYDLTAVPDPVRLAALLNLLGLSSEAVRWNPAQGEVSYLLILGSDYKPCFHPTNLNP